MTKPKDPDRHRNKGILIRPDPDLRTRGTKVLDDNDWTMNEFVSAALELLARNPDAMLQRLAQFKPVRKLGRPAKAKT